MLVGILTTCSTSPTNKTTIATCFLQKATQIDLYSVSIVDPNKTKTVLVKFHAGCLFRLWFPKAWPPRMHRFHSNTIVYFINANDNRSSLWHSRLCTSFQLRVWVQNTDIFLDICKLFSVIVFMCTKGKAIRLVISLRSTTVEPTVSAVRSGFHFTWKWVPFSTILA